MNYTECVRNYWAGNLSSSGSLAQGTVMGECGFPWWFYLGVLAVILVLLMFGKKKAD